MSDQLITFASFMQPKTTFASFIQREITFAAFMQRESVIQEYSIKPYEQYESFQELLLVIYILNYAT